MKTSLFTKASIKNGELVYPIKASETRVKNFLKTLPDDAKIELFISVTTGHGSTAQLAKIHAMIRDLANELGYTFEEMKLQTKRKTGLCFNQDKVEYCKSFADCDVPELNLVIQTLIEIGDFSNINLR
jgi:hypothetical protein